jgi:hypothetical protein
MAKAKSQTNGHLEQALANMLQSTATLVQTQAAFVADKRETDARRAELDRIGEERFARIETMLLEHNRILVEQSEQIRKLTEAVREKFGFKA